MPTVKASLPKIHCSDLQPRQRRTRPGFKRSTDCYERMMLKHPYRSVFHSRAELYFAALLEANPCVEHYVPQPFHLRISGKPYIPDCYRLYQGRKEIIELKPRGEFDDAITSALTAFFQHYDMHFLVISNEWALEQSMLAENWLMIIGQLITTQEMETHVEEEQVLDRLTWNEELSLGTLIDPGDRLGHLVTETALFRLLHRGKVHAKLADAPLDYNTLWSIAV